LSATDIRRLFGLLDAELAAAGVTGEVFVVGGAVMCLALGARESTLDVDGVFRPEQEVRAAAERVAMVAGVAHDWLNDAAKGLIGSQGAFDAFLDLPNLRVYVAQPMYMLAMKCVAMRLDVGVSDRDDVKFLLRYLDIRSVDEVLGIISRYFNEDRVLVKTRLAVEELLRE
jgi:hypothetical protein